MADLNRRACGSSSANSWTTRRCARWLHASRSTLFGTNPIAAIFPRREGASLTIDLSLSEVARGKVMVAAKQGEPIPLGWALDVNGNPTTDAQAALEGSMLPMGGTKGAMLAMVVELLACALTGAAMGFEADTFFVDAGNQPRIGPAFLVIDPDALAGRSAYFDRIETLIEAMMADEGVRLPGARRDVLAARASQRGHRSSAGARGPARPGSPDSQHPARLKPCPQVICGVGVGRASARRDIQQGFRFARKCRSR